MTTSRANLFETIASKSILSFHLDNPDGAPSSRKCFALMRSVEKKPKRHLYGLLQAQGMQANQRVTFFSDGGDTVRMLPAYCTRQQSRSLTGYI